MLILLVVLLALPLFAQRTCYVRDGGTATSTNGCFAGGGSPDWGDTSKVYDTIAGAEAAINRSNGAYTIYVAAGTYAGATLDAAENGTTLVTFKKATASDHGTETGWQSSYADPATVTSSLLFRSSYWTWDGQYRLECANAGELETTTCWRSGYGFKHTGNDPFEIGIAFSTSETDITIRYAECEGSGVTNGSVLDRCVRIALSSARITISHTYLHDVDESNIHGLRVDGLTVEHSWLARNCIFPTHCEAIVAAEGTTDLIVRHNIFEDIGSTAYIATPTGGNGDCDHQQAGADWYIYGNVFWGGAGTRNSGAGVIYNFSSTINGDFKIFNNTFVDLDDGLVGNEADEASQGCSAELEAKNNLYVDIAAAGISCTNVTSCTVTHNAFWDSPNSESGTSVYQVSGNPLTDYSNKDFSLTSSAASAMDAGTTLSAPYDADMFGVTRGADGKWDRGALEFDAGGPSLPTVTTSAASDIAQTTATGNGNVTDDGGDTITERGVCWGTSANPTVGGTCATSAGTTGVFTASMTGLTANTLYHYRAYATNSVGTSYGADTEFTTLAASGVSGRSTGSVRSVGAARVQP